MKDMFGKTICVGNIVLKPIMLGRSPFIEKRVVSSIENGNMPELCSVG